MGLLLILIVIVMFMYIPIHRTNKNWNDRQGDYDDKLKAKQLRIKSVIPICWVLFGVGLLYSLCICVSYNSYMDNKIFYHDTHEQYINSLKVYYKYATLDSDTKTMTDLVYKDYQTNVASFITILRNKIVSYNKSIVSKRIMKNNFMFSWWIIAPDDDMIPIKLETLYKEIDFGTVN